MHSTLRVCVCVCGAATCDDVLNGSIFALIDVSAVFDLFLFELLD